MGPGLKTVGCNVGPKISTDRGSPEFLFNIHTGKSLYFWKVTTWEVFSTQIPVPYRIELYFMETPQPPSQNLGIVTPKTLQD